MGFRKRPGVPQDKKRKADSYFDMVSRGRRKTRNLVLLGMLGVAVALGAAVYYYATVIAPAPGVGPVGSTHQHAQFRLAIDGERFEFEKPPYQLRSQYVHFEEGNGFILHKHATGVTIGFTFQTLGMRLDDASLTLDNGTVLRSGSGKTFKFYVNGAQMPQLARYEVREGDQILIYFGEDTEAKIQEQVAALNAQPGLP